MGVVARQSGRSEPKAGPASSASSKINFSQVQNLSQFNFLGGFVNSKHKAENMSPSQKSFSRIENLSIFFLEGKAFFVRVL